MNEGIKKQIAFGQAKTIFIIGVLLLAVALFGCTQPKPLTAENLSFEGVWATESYATGMPLPVYKLTIYGNGTADFEGTDEAFKAYGGSSKLSVNGGQIEINDSNLSVGMFGINRTFRIDQRPMTKDGKESIILDGVTLYKWHNTT